MKVQKKIILTFIIVSMVSFLIVVGNFILTKVGYYLVIPGMADDVSGYILLITLFLCLFFLFLSLALRYKKHRFQIMNIAALCFVIAFLLWFFFRVEQSTYRKGGVQWATYEKAIASLEAHSNKEADINYINGYFIFPNDEYSTPIYDADNEILDLITSLNVKETNTGIIKKKIKEVIKIKGSLSDIIIDDSLTRIKVEYTVDGHLYIDKYVRYYNIDYKSGKLIYDKALELANNYANYSNIEDKITDFKTLIKYGLKNTSHYLITYNDKENKIINKNNNQSLNELITSIEFEKPDNYNFQSNSDLTYYLVLFFPSGRHVKININPYQESCIKIVSGSHLTDKVFKLSKSDSELLYNFVINNT